MGGQGAISKPAAAMPGEAVMRSPVNWALLGLVVERPSYGYELAQRFEQVYGDVLPISGMSHIYIALHALRNRSLIEEVPAADAAEIDARRQPRPYLRATVQGMHDYRDRLVAQRREDDRRSQLFARQLAVFRCDPDAALDVLRRYERACLDEAARTPIAPAHDPSLAESSELIARLACEESRLTAGARLSWVQYARREFGALARSGAQRQ